MDSRTVEKQSASPEEYRIQDVLVGLELGPGDGPILDYLDFFSCNVPIGTLHFLHVIPRVKLFSESEDDEEFLRENYQMADELHQRIGQKIKARECSRKVTFTDFSVRIGNPLEEMLKQATGLNANLLVIGQLAGKNKHGILAKNLARKTTGNALIVPEKAPHRLTHFLVPVDFSGHSVLALRTAIALKKRLEHPVRITCLHVFELPTFPLNRVKSKEEVLEMLRRDREAAFTHFLERYVPDDMHHLETRLMEKSGQTISHHILEFGEEQGVDLLVMGAIGHSKVELLLMGSVTEKVLNQNDRIATLVVKH